MAKVIEPFLINPPRRLARPKRRVALKSKKNPWYGEPGRHRLAAGAGYAGPSYSTPRLAKVWGRLPKRIQKAVQAQANPMRRVKRRVKHNPFGEELMIVGLNPVSRGGEKIMARKRRKLRLHDNAPKRRRRVRLHANPAKRRRVKLHGRVRLHANPVHKRKSIRRHRRNPAIAASRASSGIMIDWTKPMTYLPLMATAGVATITTITIPKLIKLNAGWQKTLVQAAIAVGGGFAADKVLGRKHAAVFSITSGAVIIADLLNTYILKGFGLSGLGNDLLDSGYDSNMAYYQNAMAGLGYDGMGADDDLDGLGTFEDETGEYVKSHRDSSSL